MLLYWLVVAPGTSSSLVLCATVFAAASRSRSSSPTAAWVDGDGGSPSPLSSLRCGGPFFACCLYICQWPCPQRVRRIDIRNVHLVGLLRLILPLPLPVFGWQKVPLVY